MSSLIFVVRSGRQWPVARTNCPNISMWKVWRQQRGNQNP